MKVAICTLGCKVNQYETQALEQELMHRGHTLTDFEETADIYVVNTCSVTAVSDKKSRQMLRQAKRRNPAAVIAACGCYAQTHPEDVKKLDLDVIARNRDLHIVRRVTRTAVLAVTLEEHREGLAHTACKVRFVHLLGNGRGARGAGENAHRQRGRRVGAARV